MKKNFTAALVVLFTLGVADGARAATPAAGAVCTDNTAGAISCYQNGCYVCTSGSWVPQALHVGATASACSSTLAGMLKWTGTAILYCDGTAWTSLGTPPCNEPAAFSFTNQTGVSVGSTVTSNSVILTGANFSCLVGASCPLCSGILRNGSSGTQFLVGDSIALKVIASSSPGTAVTPSATVGVTSSTWSVTTDTCSTPGQVCLDGSVYVGLSPDGNLPMFTTRCDFGASWNGSSCVGGAKKSWNNESTTYVSTGYTSLTTGKSNTAGLVALYNAPAPYNAARACSDLVVHGQSDWYLPSKNELALVGALGPFGTYETHWSSSEALAKTAYSCYSYGSNTCHSWSDNNKDTTYFVRCVRRGN